ncbi:hypothetical protein [Streptomyces sp. NPDC085596]|uniref:hypothetical protein n=1 Tax=Streptomyces sp. NPDC085596 TaxID=3365731 RepID=UPI0037D83CE4
MTSYAFTLSFTQIRCSRCGVERIRGLDCPDCGRIPQPWEIDTDTLRRREAATEAQTLLAQPGTALPARPLGAPETLHAGLFERLAEWMPRFFRAVAAVADRREQNAADLETAVSDFIELRAIIHNADARRPMKALVTILGDLVTELTFMIDAYLAALLAQTPLEAQKHGVRAQRHLDRVNELGSRANTCADTVKMLTAERDAAQTHAVLLTRALHTFGASDLLALDDAARDELMAITSSRGVDGCGLMFATCHVLARSMFDPEQFFDILRRAYKMFRSNPDVLRSLAQEPFFETDLKRAVCELFDSSMEAAHAVDHAVHSRQAGRALLGIAASQVEGPGQVIASALLLACGRKSAAYTNLRHKNATELITAAQKEPLLQGLLGGLDNDLRNGRAHAQVRYEEQGAVIELKKITRTVAWPEVIDEVFQGDESIHACQLALFQALGELGFTGFAVDGLWHVLGLTAEQMVTMTLEASGCRGITITPGKHWQVEARVASPLALSLQIALIRPYLPERTAKLTFTAHQDDGVHTLAGPLAPWLQYAQAPQDSEEKSMAYLRAQLSWTYDNAPVLSTDLVRRWVARQAEETMEQIPAVAIGRLRNFRDLAASAGDDALVQVLTGVIRYKRLGKAGNAEAELSQMQAWCHVPAVFPAWC